MMRKCSAILFATGLLIGAVGLWAQGQGAGAGTRGSGGGISTPGSPSSPGQRQQDGGFGNANRNDPFGRQQRDTFRSQPRPLYLHGRVLTDNGQPPSEPVIVQRVCASNIYPEGYTDSKGRFSFEVGGNSSLVSVDASVSGAGLNRVGFPRSGDGFGGLSGVEGVRQVGLGRFDLSGCTLRAELSGHRSDELNLGMFSVMANNDVGVIVLHRLDGVAGHVVSASTLAAPKSAQKAYQSGLRELRKKKPNFQKGIAQFEKAVAAYPEFAAAWAAMGDARMALRDAEGAWAAFSKALEADPKYLKPYEPLIRMAIARKDWQAMESLGTAYLELNPNARNIRYMSAIAALNAGHPEKAEEIALSMRAGESGGKFPESYQIMGLVHERRADFQKAAEQYRAYIEFAGESMPDHVQQIERKLHEWAVLGVIEDPSQ